VEERGAGRKAGLLKGFSPFNAYYKVAAPKVSSERVAARVTPAERLFSREK